MKKEETSLYKGVWVDGAGPLDAELLLVGRDPGAVEERAGEPFVGPSGQLLQACVSEAGLDWSKIRRTNALRCRTPENRQPTDDELKEYLPWLLDEIAAGLTPLELADLVGVIRHTRERGVTIIVVEHLMRMILRLCDKIVVLHYGEKIAEGTPEEICQDKRVAEAYLGENYLL